MQVLEQQLRNVPGRGWAYQKECKTGTLNESAKNRQGFQFLNLLYVLHIDGSLIVILAVTYEMYVLLYHSVSQRVPTLKKKQALPILSLLDRDSILELLEKLSTHCGKIRDY